MVHAGTYIPHLCTVLWLCWAFLGIFLARSVTLLLITIIFNKTNALCSLARSVCVWRTTFPRFVLATLLAFHRPARFFEEALASRILAVACHVHVIVAQLCLAKSLATFICTRCGIFGCYSRLHGILESNCVSLVSLYITRNIGHQEKHEERSEHNCFRHEVHASI
uniref:Uncharacterized protein n=1 Tax=Rhipicephalus microplus TaxID=6941 RepID=A0A6G5A2A8_RHIMP